MQNTTHSEGSQSSALLTIIEVMLRLKVGRSAVMKLIEEGELRSIRMSPRIIRVSEGALDEYIQNAETSSTEEDSLELSSS
jgi:excisionase family DNA binding protein